MPGWRCAGSWEAVDRIGRSDWMDYLRWYRRVLNLPVRNEVAVVGIAPEDAWLVLSLQTPQGAQQLRARRVILATGYDGAGEWRIPLEIAVALPPERCRHSNTAIDFAAYRGKRLGILGHGASAFDAAITALTSGARSVDLCFRRDELPSVNPHRHIEFAGLLKHFPDLDDAIRWGVNVYFDAVDQPPAQYSYDSALAYANFAIHPSSPWLDVGMAGDEIQIRTRHRSFVFDEIICATGSAVDFSCRPEMTGLVGDFALWRDRYTPPPSDAHDRLGFYPYLGPHYDLQEREPGTAPHIPKIHAFSFAAIVSMGPHSTSASGLKYAIPRLIRGLTRSLFLEQQGGLLEGLRAYRETEINWPPNAA
jgi:cation diffusion facilitator CzcD-associated flavoprotein CzcO